MQGMERVDGGVSHAGHGEGGRGSEPCRARLEGKMRCGAMLESAGIHQRDTEMHKMKADRMCDTLDPPLCCARMCDLSAVQVAGIHLVHYVPAQSFELQSQPVRAVWFIMCVVWWPCEPVLGPGSQSAALPPPLSQTL